MSYFALGYSMVVISMPGVAYLFSVAMSFAELEKVEDLFCCLDSVGIEFSWSCYTEF